MTLESRPGVEGPRRLLGWLGYVGYRRAPSSIPRFEIFIGHPHCHGQEMPRAPLRVALAGLGAVGLPVADVLLNNGIPGMTLSAAAASSPERAAARLQQLASSAGSVQCVPVAEACVGRSNAAPLLQRLVTAQLPGRRHPLPHDAFTSALIVGHSLLITPT